jgi:hypothetical protein
MEAERTTFLFFLNQGRVYQGLLESLFLGLDQAPSTIPLASFLSGGCRSSPAMFVEIVTAWPFPPEQ